MAVQRLMPDCDSDLTRGHVESVLAFIISDLTAFVPLETRDQQHLRAAHGYIDLGMYIDANEELEKITPDVRHVPEILEARLLIYQGTAKWEAMEAIATALVDWNPDEPGFFIQLGYATRRAKSLSEARQVLVRAEQLHPADGLIQFNLACYEAQLGNRPAAKEHLQRAIEADTRFKVMALDDPDLKPLWPELRLTS